MSKQHCRGIIMTFSVSQPVNTVKKQLPTGIQTFTKLREKDCYYVDKTKYLIELSKETAVFLSRPRRFGKSLTIDTLAELFSGNKTLFTGLYAENHWDWEITYPVIRLGFAEGQITDAEKLTEELHSQLAKNEQKYQVAVGNANRLHDRFRSLIEKVSQKHNSLVVILIDEYDKPMVDNINTDAILGIRDVLRDLYSVIKGQDAHIRFSMLTGVSKFSRVNIFSGLNSLTDISLMSRYSALCGYTQNELESVFAPELVDVDLQKMKDWYNGYNWSGESVYNPYDVLLFLAEKSYQPHWFKTGSSAWLVDNLATDELDMHSIENNTYNIMDLEKFDIDEVNPIAVLFQAGYLTIKETLSLPMGTLYKLKYPNVEVQQSLNQILLSSYLGKNYSIANEQFNLYQCLLNNDFDKVKQLFHAFYASIPHQWYTSRNECIGHYEGHYASVFYSFLTGLGVRVHCEDSTNQGRMDAWFDFNGIIYLIEFKLVENARQLKEGEKNKGVQAIEQIKDKNYAEKFTAQQTERGKPIVMMGVVFGKEERNIVAFEVEQINC